MTLDTSGLMSLMPLARYDRATQSWRTSEATSLWDLPMSLETLPAWGMTLNGELYELPMPEPLTTAHEFSSLPTPMARDYKDSSFPPRLWGPKAYMSELPTAVAVNLLPTPTVNDMGAGKDPQAWDEWTDRMKQAHGNGNGHGKSLEQEALKMLPTPTSGDCVGTGYAEDWSELTQANGRHRLRDAAHLLGANTPQQSSAGSPSSDDQHQLPLFSVGKDTA